METGADNNTTMGGTGTAAGGSKLPFLPGMTFVDPTKTRFHKSQAFTKADDGRCECNELKPGIGGSALSEAQAAAIQKASFKPETSGDYFSSLSPPNAADVPNWADATLRFEAFCTEQVPGQAERVVRVAISFYLEDDSMSISALDFATGRPAGMLVKRHRVPREGAEDARQHVTAREVNVGEELVVYARTYHVVRCDLFTRETLTRLGVSVAEDGELPADLAEAEAAERASKSGTKRGGLKSLTDDPDAMVRRDPLKQFLENDRKVLRFLCVWDDRNTPYGELRKFRIHYFLSDDNIEILEDAESAQRRGMPVTFATKQARPRDFPAVKDMRIGSTVTINSRTFLVYDLDGFTKKYFTDRYGITEFRPIKIDEVAGAEGQQPGGEKQRTSGTRQKVARVIPEHNGFGSEEDSLSACLSLVPKPPKSTMTGLSEDLYNKTMQFKAIPVVPEENNDGQSRSFVLVYKFATDGVTINELQAGGKSGKKFFEGTKVKNTRTNTKFGPADFFVGGRVTVQGRDFVLESASEWTLRYMESNPAQFPQSDLDKVVTKLVKLGKPTVGRVADSLTAEDKTKSGLVTLDALRTVLDDAGAKLTEQELLTLKRRFELDPASPTLHHPSLIAQINASMPSEPRTPSTK